MIVPRPICCDVVECRGGRGGGADRSGADKLESVWIRVGLSVAQTPGLSRDDGFLRSMIGDPDLNSGSIVNT